MTPENNNEDRHILFLCTGNSCRSQMAEGFGHQLAPETTHVYSAGIESHGLNPTAVKAMEEVGISITEQKSKTLDDVPVDKITEVITLCDHAEQTCPAFPGAVKQTHWPLPDPASASGSEQEIMETFRSVRDRIRRNIQKYFENSES